MTKEILYRKSRQRSRIMTLLQSTTSHPTAQEIYDKLRHEFPNLSLGTVYRNLNILVEQGEAGRLQNGSTFDRYDGRTEPHYHFTCTVCDRVYDLPVSPFPDLEKVAAEQSGHAIHTHSVDFFGVCTSCRRDLRTDRSADPAV